MVVITETGKMDQPTQVIGQSGQGNGSGEENTGHSDESGREEDHKGIHVRDPKGSQPPHEAVGCNDMQVQRVWGESKTDNAGGLGARMGMMGHQSGESHTIKAFGRGEVQSSHAMYLSNWPHDVGTARFSWDGTYFGEMVMDAGIREEVIRWRQ